MVIVSKAVLGPSTPVQLTAPACFGQLCSVVLEDSPAAAASTGPCPGAASSRHRHRTAPGTGLIKPTRNAPACLPGVPCCKALSTNHQTGRHSHSTLLFRLQPVVHDTRGVPGAPAVLTSWDPTTESCSQKVAYGDSAQMIASGGFWGLELTYS